MNIKDLHALELNGCPRNLVQAVLKKGTNFGGAVMLNEQEDIAFKRDPVHPSIGERDQDDPSKGWLHPFAFTLDQWATVHIIEGGAKHWQSPDDLQRYQRLVIEARAYPEGRSENLCRIVNTVHDHFVLPLACKNYREYSPEKARERRGRIQAAKVVVGRVWR